MNSSQQGMTGQTYATYLSRIAQARPELRGARRGGLVARASAAVLDLTFCTWIALQFLQPVTLRFREQVIEMFGVRALALAIDAGTLSYEQLQQVMLRMTEDTARDLRTFAFAYGISIAIVFLAVLPVYFWFFEATRFSATPGKMAMGLRVLNNQFRPIGVFQSFYRQLGKLATLCSVGILALDPPAPFGLRRIT